MIDRAHDLPVTRQAQVLQISRGAVVGLLDMGSGAHTVLSPELEWPHARSQQFGARAAVH